VCLVVLICEFSVANEIIMELQFEEHDPTRYVFLPSALFHSPIYCQVPESRVIQHECSVMCILFVASHFGEGAVSL